MNKKDSKYASALTEALTRSVNRTSEGPLAAAYRVAVMSVCDVHWVNIRDADHIRLANRRKELDERGIDYQDYASVVVKTWNGWCQLQGMMCISVPIFCGPKALSRYLRDKERREYVEIDSITEDDHHAQVREEIAVALMFISGYPFASLLRIRDLLAPTQDYPPNPEIVDEVLDLMNQAYGLAASDYEQLAQQHRQRYATHGSHNSSKANQAIQIEGVGMSSETWLGE